MYPFSYHLLREYQRVQAEKDRQEQRRIRDAMPDMNEVTFERPHQGRFTAAVSRLRERLPARPAPFSTSVELTEV